MSGLKEIRNRISSVSSTMQITNAMKMVSAAKLKKAQDSISATLPYSNKLSELIKNISASTDSDDTNPLFEKRELKNLLIIAITSNKGLCGGFNSNIIKEVNNIKTASAFKRVDLLTIGKKGDDILSKKFEVISSHNDVYDNFNYNYPKLSLFSMFIELLIFIWIFYYWNPGNFFSDHRQLTILFLLSSCFFSSRLKILISATFDFIKCSKTAFPKEPVPPVTKIMEFSSMIRKTIK